MKRGKEGINGGKGEDRSRRYYFSSLGKFLEEWRSDFDSVRKEKINIENDVFEIRWEKR